MVSIFGQGRAVDGATVYSAENLHWHSIAVFLSLSLSPSPAVTSLLLHWEGPDSIYCLSACDNLYKMINQSLVHATKPHFCANDGCVLLSHPVYVFVTLFLFSLLINSRNEKVLRIKGQS